MAAFSSHQEKESPKRKASQGTWRINWQRRNSEICNNRKRDGKKKTTNGVMVFPWQDAVSLQKKPVSVRSSWRCYSSLRKGVPSISQLTWHSLGMGTVEDGEWAPPSSRTGGFQWLLALSCTMPSNPSSCNPLPDHQLLGTWPHSSS